MPNAAVYSERSPHGAITSELSASRDKALNSDIGVKCFVAQLDLGAAAAPLAPLVTLPSDGDCSYAGMVWHEGRLWLSYYSSHEGKSAVYLAELKTPQAGR